MTDASDSMADDGSPTAQGPAPAPFVSQSPSTLQSESAWFEGKGGVKLHERRWRPAGAPRACLVIVHGLKDHGARYGEVAAALASEGVVTMATDLRGHGKSQGERVWVDSFDDYLSDLDLSVQRARDTYPDRPLFLLGHSMGATIAALYTITWKPKIDGLILTGGSLKPNASLTPEKILAAKELSAHGPHHLTLQLNDELFSRDASVVAGMASDPLIEDGPGPARTGAELIAARERLQPREGEITVPLLVLHGSADQVCNPEGSKELVERAGSKDKTLVMYEGSFHDLLHDLDHQAVVADIVRWVAARAAPRVAVPA